MLPLNGFLTRLMPGALAVLLLGGVGYYAGLKAKQSEVDKLQARLYEYKSLGGQMMEIKTAIEKDMRDKNQALVDAYKVEIGTIRTEFDTARRGLESATGDLKRGGKDVTASTGSLVAAIKNLPPGAERDEKIFKFIELMTDPQKRQQLCAVTRVADSQVQSLKSGFTIGAP